MVLKSFKGEEYVAPWCRVYSVHTEKFMVTSPYETPEVPPSEEDDWGDV